MRTRFTFTDADLEQCGHALLEAHGNPYRAIPEEEREAALANAEGDAEAVLKAAGGEWVE